jgi:chitin disaccharide deacetylase
MSANPMLKALGLSDDDRVVLIHTDDIGMCHASLDAYAGLLAEGVISAASTMVPCPWFQATAQFCAAHPESVDMGVHITLNAEWHTGYRWEPVSTRDPESGLMDEQGYMHHTVEAVQTHARPAAVHQEITTQVRMALDAGIDVTHIDTHMGTVFYGGFLESYLQVAMEVGVPPFMVRKDAAALQAMGFPSDMAEGLAGQITTLEARGLPMFDDVSFVPFSTMDAHFDHAKQVLGALKPGLTYLIIHPSTDTPELRAILPDGWQNRVADYEVFMRRELRDYLDAEGIRLIGWREIRELMRAQV